MVNVNLVLLMGLWIVSISTVPIYFWYKILQRKNCKHDYIKYRLCEKCGQKEREIVKEDLKTVTEKAPEVEISA